MSRPCVRGLKVFEQDGCPERKWDGNRGCPMWVDAVMAKHGEPGTEYVHACQDELIFRFNYAICGLLAGNQQATESFRNGMVVEDEKGQTTPKPDRGTLIFLSLFQNAILKQKIITEYELEQMIGQSLMKQVEDETDKEQEVITQ